MDGGRTHKTRGSSSPPDVEVVEEVVVVLRTRIYVQRKKKQVR